MSETGTMVRIVMALGMLFLIMGLLNPGDDAAWNNFQAATAQPVVIPKFDDPFQSRYAHVFSVNTFPTGSGVHLSTGDCDDYVDCLRRLDDAFVIFATGDFEGIPVNFTADQSGADQFVYSVIVRVSCFTVSFDEDNPTKEMAIAIPLSVIPEAAPININCPIYTPIHPPFNPATEDLPVAIQTMTISWAKETSTTSNIWGAVKDDAGVSIAAIDPKSGPDYTSPPNNFQVYLGYVAWEMFTAEDVSCAEDTPEGAWFPWLDEVACNISRFTIEMVKGFLFIGRALWWVVSAAVAVVGFIGGVVVNLIIAVVTMLSLMFVIPGTPAIVQGLIDIILVGLIVFIVVTVVKLVRGSGSGME